MKMKQAGIFCLAASLLLSAGNFAFTGAVIGAGLYSYVSILALSFFIAGVVLILVSGTLEQRVERKDSVSFSEFKRSFNRNFPGYKTLIADSSFLINYAEAGDELIDYLNSYDVVVPQEVLDEIGGKSRKRNSLLKKIVEANSRRPNGDYKKYLPIAEESLSQGSKAYVRDLVVSVIKGEVEEPRFGDVDYLLYHNAMTQLASKFTVPLEKVPRDNLIKGVNKTLGVSKADAAVLACAMAERDVGESPIVLEKDIDFEEAINYLHNIGKSSGLHYFNVYGRAA